MTQESSLESRKKVDQGSKRKIGGTHEQDGKAKKAKCVSPTKVLITVHVECKWS